MSAISGLLAVANANTNDLVGEFQETILVRNAKGFNVGTTLFGLMAKLKTEATENSEFNWFERDPVKREMYVNTANATVPGSVDLASQTIVLGDTSDGSGNAYPYLSAGHLLRNSRTGENMLVTADPSTNTITVTRAFKATSAQLAGFTLVVGDPIVIISLGKFEGADPVRTSYEEPTILTNYIQTFNSTVELTNAFKNNVLRSDAEGPLNDRRIQALERIAKDIETSLFFGVKARTNANNKAQWFTGGIKDGVDSAAPSNVLDGQSTSGIDLETFNNWLQSFMSYGSDTKLMFCGTKSYAMLSTYANQAVNGLRYVTSESVFGMNITVINTPFGEISLANHPLFKEIPSYVDVAFCVDLAHLVQKVQEPLFLERNIQTPGNDSYKEQYRAKLGLKLKFANAFGYAVNLQKIV